MIKKIIVTNDVGHQITLDLYNPWLSGFAVKSITGLGPSDATVNITDIVTQDGGIYNSARQQQRNIVLELLFVQTTKGESIETVRQKTYRYFPVKRPITIQIETDNRKAVTTGYVESNEPNIFSKEEGTSISIICPDPHLYSAGNDDVTTFLTVTPNFEFPFSNESLLTPTLLLGTINTTSAGTVNYRGDSEVGMIVYIHAAGLAENIVISNIQTGEQMAIDTDKLTTITGSAISKGDDIYIDTVKGEKSVTLIRDGKYYNILNCLDKDSDWLSLVKGDNLFAFNADKGVTNLYFQIINKTLYEGV